MNIIEATKTCLITKYANFYDRAPRSEYWWFQLVVFLAGQVNGQIVNRWLYEVPWLYIYTWALVVMFFVPSISAVARRLHDTGRSGWSQLWAITIIGIPVVIWWLVLPGDLGENRYGYSPHRLKKAPEQPEASGRDSV